MTRRTGLAVIDKRRRVSAGWVPSRVAALAAFVLASGACGAPGPGHTFELTEENGVPVAVNSAVPRYDGEIFTYEKILEIRADPDNAASQLYQPRTFTLGDDGLYYVADTGNHRIAVFDAAGAFTHSIGRAGEGPGELQDPRVARVRDGVVTVSGAKTSRFAVDGTFIDALSVPRPPIERTNEGLIVSFGFPQGGRDDGYYYLGAVAEVVDGVGNVVASVEIPQFRFGKLTGEGRRRTQLHFAGVPFIDYVPTDEILTTTGLDPVVSWYGLDGSLKRQVRIELEPPAVTGEDRDLVEAHYDRLIGAARAVGEDGQALAARLLSEKATLEYAERKALWRRVTVEHPGWLWLHRPMPDYEVYVRGSARIAVQQSFRIVNPEGEYLGNTSWPPEARRGSEVVRGRLLTMIPDPVTEETIPTVFVIRPAVPGLEYPGTEPER